MLERLWTHLLHLAGRGAIAVPLVVALLGAPGAPPLYAHTPRPKIAPGLQARTLTDPLRLQPIIIQMQPASLPFASAQNDVLAQQAASLLQSYGVLVGTLPIIDGAAGWANSAAITALSLLPQVAEVDLDAIVSPQKPTSSGTPLPPGQVDSMYVHEVNADQVRQQGDSGQGVTVAVLDSGVAADADLTQNGNRILAHASFAGPPDPQHPDPGGHGTHIAGIVAGDGAKSGGQYPGIAPYANIVDVQVLDANGNGRVSSILAGLDWVLVNQKQYNIRVVNLSLGALPLTSYKTDPLAAGVEMAWRHGLVVVCAAGNGGPASGTVVSPGIDPYVITVGSTDDQTTPQLSDDTVGWWSAWGQPPNSTAKPDIVAPGRRLVSLRVPGSSLDQLLPDHVVPANNGTSYFRLTGTSMSTGVVSGLVALLLERQPNLDPDQVKKVVMSTTQPFGQNAPAPPAGSIGAGLTDAYHATFGTPSGRANGGQRQANGLAMTLYPMLYGKPLTLLSGGLVNWTNIAWDNIAWDNIAWDNIAWDNIAWDNIAWDNIAWDNIAWDQSGWDNIAWDNIAWD